MILFDENGFLTPYNTATSVKLTDIEAYLVKPFPNSTTRQGLYSHYIDYVLDLQNNICPDFVQWINGSFVSQKENPQDIDLVTFIPHTIFEQFEKTLQNYKGLALKKAKGLDAYLLPLYPEEHKLHYLNELNYQEWRILFSHTRRSPRTNKSFSKGYLSLTF